MKTVLALIILSLALIVMVKGFPAIMVPAGLAFVGTLLVCAALSALAVALLSGVLGLGFGILCTLLLLLVCLSPIWLPVLAVVGVVSLVRRSRTKTA